jgi:hypothetical protein
MLAFRLYLAAFFACLLAYTAVVIAEHGWNLFPIFFGDVAAMTWPGQFNLDFMGFLTLSGLWLAWRHHFSPTGVILGLIGIFGGMGFLIPYLLIASFNANGDVRELLMGKARVGH